MKIRLVSHAGVVVEARGVRVLCDPWLFGKAFNDSWSLFPDPVWDESWLEEIDYLWISHEHPDHLHFPTLKSFPEEWRKRVTVLYQDRAADDVRAALRKLGYENVRLLGHRERTSLGGSVEAYSFHAPHGDSCLAVCAPDAVCLNLNDAQVDQEACQQMRADLGRMDAVLKQFSLAGYTGGKDYAAELPAMAESILIHMVGVHWWLGSQRTIPFASFVYFSSRDNAFMNDYANTPRAAWDYLVEHGCDGALLYPGDEMDVHEPWDSAARLARFDADRERFASMPIDDPPIVELAELEKAFARFSDDIHDKFTQRRLARLPPVRIRVPDLETTLEMSIADRALRDLATADGEAHLEAGSHALQFAFSAPFGFETMTISARVFVLNETDWPWVLSRDLLWLYRRGVWLAPKWLLSPANLKRVWPWALGR